MKVRILCQSLMVDGRTCCEGEVVDTADGHIIAYALGLKELRRGRLRNDGVRMEGDNRAAEPVSEPTEEDYERARAAIADSAAGPPGPYARPRRRRPVELGDESLSKLSAVMTRAAGKRTA